VTCTLSTVARTSDKSLRVTAMERPVANLTIMAQSWTAAELAAVIEQPVLVDDPMLTVAQAAALLGITQGAVDRLVRPGLLRRRRRPGSSRTCWRGRDRTARTPPSARRRWRTWQRPEFG